MCTSFIYSFFVLERQLRKFLLGEEIIFSHIVLDNGEGMMSVCDVMFINVRRHFPHTGKYVTAIAAGF